MLLSDRPTPLRRLPIAYFGAVYAEHLFSIAGLTIGAILSTQQGVPWAGGWGWTIFTALLLAQIVRPAYVWTSVKFSFAADGIWASTGIVNRRTRFITWESVATVQVDAPWHYRIFQLSHVTLLQGGDEATRISLPGVGQALVSELVHLARPSPEATAHPDPFAERAPAPIYRSSIIDLLIASLVYGKFASLGAAAVLVMLDGLDRLKVIPAVSQIAVDNPFIVGSIIVLCITAAGALATVVQFAGLETAIDEGALVLRYGLFSTRERIVSADAIAGVEFRRNLLEIALGRVRLSLITTDSASRLGSNLVLPSLRQDAAARIIAESQLRYIVNDSYETLPRGRSLVMSVLTLGATSTAALISSVFVLRALEAPLVYGIATLVVVFAGVHWFGSLVCARLQFDPAARLILVSTSYITIRQRILDPDFVHIVATMCLRNHPLIVRLHYYAGMPRVLAATHFEPTEVRQIARAVGHASSGES